MGNTGINFLFPHCFYPLYIPGQGPVSQRVAINRKFSQYTIYHSATIDISCTINHNPL